MIARLERPLGLGLTLGQVLGGGILAFGLAYMLPKTMGPAWEAGDFKYFWLAGELWSQGVSPYGPAFITAAEASFTRGNVPQQWAYPPHFRLIAEPVSWLGFETAALLWRLGLVALVALGTLCINAAVRIAAPHWPHGLGLLVAGLALTMSGTAQSVWLGQSSPLFFAALGGFALAWMGGHRAAMLALLVLMMVKPTYGLIPCFFLLTQRTWLPTLLAAGAVTIALTALAVLGSDPATLFRDLAGGFASYADNPVNAAFAMNGLRHVAWLAGAGDISQLVFLALGAVAAAGLGLWAGRREASQERLRALMWLGLVILTFAPLHTYDGYLVLLVTLPALALTRIEAITGLLLFLAVWRSPNLAKLTGLRVPDSFAGASIEAVAGTLALIVLIWAALRPPTA